MLKKSQKQSVPKNGRHDAAKRLLLLQVERRRLRSEIKQLKAERDQLKRSLFALMHEDIPIKKAELLALVGKQRPLRNVIGELKKMGA